MSATGESLAERNFRRRVAQELSRREVAGLVPVLLRPATTGNHTAVQYHAQSGAIEFAITIGGEFISFGTHAEPRYVDYWEVHYVAGLVDMQAQVDRAARLLPLGGGQMPYRFGPVLGYLCSYEPLANVAGRIGELSVEEGRSRIRAFREWKRQAGIGA